MTYKQLLKSDNILLKVISGSHGYGLNIATSDVDRRGIFFQPLQNLFGFNQLTQIADEKNDNTYYELSKYFELLNKNNPNIIELLHMPKDCVEIKNPLLDLIKAEDVLSKLCSTTFGQYAFGQIKKARGLNKKIVNPIDEKRKSPLDFCYIVRSIGGSKSVSSFLEEKGWTQEECGLANISNFPTLFELYHKSQLPEEMWFRGIYSTERDSNDILLSSIPKGIEPITLMSYNKDGYSKYCKDYREYWEWVKERNEARYVANMANDKNYDSKNLMHTFRLLEMASEIALEGKIIVRRSLESREFLLKVRNAEFEYDYLVSLAEDSYELVKENFAKSSLPEIPNYKNLEETMIEIKSKLYKF